MEVTSDNIQQYSIYDLVLPLYGPQIKLKEGTWIYSCLRAELDQLNLAEEDFIFLAKTQNAQAAWRKVFVKPEIV